MRAVADRDAAVKLATEFEQRYDWEVANAGGGGGGRGARQKSHASVDDLDEEAMVIRNNELHIQMKKMDVAHKVTLRTIGLELNISHRLLGGLLSLQRGDILAKYAQGRGGRALRFVSLVCTRASKAPETSGRPSSDGGVMKQYRDKEHWTVQWCSFSRSRKLSSKKLTTLQLTEIRDVTFGPISDNFTRNADKLEDEPWTCFSILTDNRTFDFAAKSSKGAMLWVEVLLLLTGRPPRGIGRLLWKSASMRMKHASTRRSMDQA
eukprot:g5204.t1